MKGEEEIGPDRSVGFQTDDEENEAETIGENGEDDEESGYSNSPSQCHSSFRDESLYGTSWPQSYRPSIDMYSNVATPNISFLGNSYLSSPTQRALMLVEDDDSLSRPFISKRPDKVSSPSFSSKWFHSKSPIQKPSYHELPLSSQCSYAQAVLNGVNILCGVGLLATPYAIKEGGWMGLLMLAGFGVISCYTGILLKKCLESTPGLHTYPDIGQAAFGVFGRLMISVVLYMELYTCCVEYITMMSDNLSALFPNVHLNIDGVIYLNPHQLFALLTTILVLPTVWLRNLSFLSYLSAGGVIASLLMVICLLWVGVVDQVGFHPSGTLLDLANLPVALGLYGFCYAGHAVFPNIYSSMKEPEQFPSVLIVSFIICWLLYSGVAVAGYLMFGESLKSQFTLNMPPQFLASKTAVWTTVVNPLAKYALTITPVALSLEELMPSPWLRCHWTSVLIRTALVLSTLFVALKVPFFGFVLALLGSLLTMVVALIFPCASYLSIMQGRASRLQVVICLLIIMVGVTCACIGSYSAIMRIANNM